MGVRIETVDTGIYTDTRVHGDLKSKIEHLKATPKLEPIDELAQIFLTAVRVVHEHGYRFAIPYQLPSEEAPPAARDAYVLCIMLFGLLERIADSRFNWEQIQMIRDAIRIGRFDERLFVRSFEPHALRGRKVLESASKGHQRVYGTAAEKKARRIALRKAWGGARKLHPGFSFAALDELVAKDQGVSARTVRRARTAPTQ